MIYSLLLFTELKTQNNEIDSILERQTLGATDPRSNCLGEHGTRIPPSIASWQLDLGSVIVDCENKHYNSGGCLRRWPLLKPVIKQVRAPRSIVTDHYLLDPSR